MLLQYLEHLSDREAIRHLEEQITWRYVLRMGIDDPVPDPSILTDFRQRLVTKGKERWLLDLILYRLRQAGRLKEVGHQRTDSTRLLAAVHRMHRVALVWQALFQVLEFLSHEAADQLVGVVEATWSDRYDPAWWRLPDSDPERVVLAEAIGQDGHRLMDHLPADHWVRQTARWQEFVHIWSQQYHPDGRWRTQKELPPTEDLHQSPVDPEARYGKKREEQWVGYVVQVTETCGLDQPPLIVDVEVHTPSERDHERLGAIQERLGERALAPSEQEVDTGYLTAQNLVDAAQRGLDLHGPPVSADDRAIYPISAFAIDWDAQQVTCPQGHTSTGWKGHQPKDKNYPVIKVQFSAPTCANCPVRAACTTGKKGRRLSLHTQEAYEALQQARAAVWNPERRQQYARRAGSEGTFSALTHGLGLRQCRYVGQAKALVQVASSAAALNMRRVLSWDPERRRPKPIRSHFCHWFQEVLAA